MFVHDEVRIQSSVGFTRVGVSRTIGLLAALVAALLTFSMAAAAPARAATAPLPTFGTQFHGVWGDYDDATRAMVLDTLKANGATTVRIDVSWRMLEPDAPGVFSAWGLGVVDNAINMAASRGLKPLVTLWMTPKWATGSDDERVAPTSAAALNALSDVSRRLAARYNGTVDGWEVWNEPNSNDFMRGADPVVYAQVLAAAYTGFKAGSPATPVVFGGPMYVDDTWVGKVLAAGGKGKYDVMGVHPYMAVADAPPDLPDDGSMWRMDHLASLIDVMSKFGEAGKPIWFTEFGWSVHPTAPDAANWQRGVTPAQATDYLQRTVTLLQSKYPTVARVYWYKDRADSADVNNTGYGLVFPNGSPTPTLAAAPAIFSNVAPPAATPGAPASLQVTVSGDRKKGYLATARWTPPVNSSVTGYTVSLRRLDKPGVTTVTVSGTTLAQQLTVVKGGTYQIAVSATNAAGTGAATVSAPFKVR
jgi:polysaccharide biosynthesis protein PslG